MLWEDGSVGLYTSGPSSEPCSFLWIKKSFPKKLVTLFLTVNKPTLFPDQWIYVPKKEIPFGGIMEPKNWSARLPEPGETSLFVEIFCWENDPVWKADLERILRLSLPWLEKLGLVKKDEILQRYIHREKFAYPVYDREYRQNLGVVKNYLRSFANLKLIGRAGCFHYNNRDHALEMGILAARSIIEEKQYNPEEMGAEQEYFERGYIK